MKLIFTSISIAPNQQSDTHNLFSISFVTLLTRRREQTTGPKCHNGCFFVHLLLNFFTRITIKWVQTYQVLVHQYMEYSVRSREMCDFLKFVFSL